MGSQKSCFPCEILSDYPINLETTNINKFYPVQLWLTTLLIGPIIMAVSSYAGGGEFSFLFVVLLASIPFSLPVLLIDLFLFKILRQKFYSPILIKLLFNFISVAGIIISFQIISGSMAKDFTFIYSGAIILSSLLFRVHKKKVFQTETLLWVRAKNLAFVVPEFSFLQIN